MKACAHSGSSARAPKPAVSAKLSSPIVISVISSAPPSVTVTATGPAKPCADDVAVREPASTVSSSFRPSISRMYSPARLTALVTALEVIVAAVIASTVLSAGVPPALITRSGVCLPLN